MSKQTSIKQQLASIATSNSYGDWALSRDLAAVVTARRLNASQRLELETLMADVPTGIKPTQSQQLAAYRSRYHATVTASGNSSLNNGDPVALELAGKSAIEVMALADTHCPIKGGQTHAAKYERLNEGSKRMNAGNKLRAAFKRGDWAIAA